MSKRQVTESRCHRLLDQAVESIYEGILVEQSRVGALRLIAEASGSVQASLVVMKRRTNRFSINENFNIPDTVFAGYNHYYHRHDPGLQFVDRIRPGHWYQDTRHFGERAMQRSEYYQDFMRGHGLASTIANRLSCDTDVVSSLSLQRATGQAPYDEDDMRRLAEVIPHLQRAIRIRSRLQSMELEAEVATSALDRLRLPLLVVDEAGRLLLVNTEAESVLRRNAFLRIRQGRLMVGGLQAGLLEQLLRNACGIDGPAVAGGAWISETERWQASQLVVTPLPAAISGTRLGSRPLALVMLHEPLAAQMPQDSLLRHLYGLTPAEVRVAMAVLGGATPAETARQNGVGISTVRSQLKAIFLKTGTKRQAELIRLLMPLLALER
ncbi:MAG: helix-turn-helix transcriptional regulator [Burkholderiaceae bacterium]